MADTKVSALPAASAAAAANELLINEAGTSKKLTASQLQAFINPYDAWEGNIALAFGNGNPRLGMLNLMGVSTAPTPTNIGTSVARISYFRLAKDLVVNKIRYYGVGATTNVYRIAIYNGDTLARVLTETQFTTSSGAWGSIGSALALTLSAGQLYFLAVSVNATGTTAGVMSLGPASAATPAGLPKSLPGNLDPDAGFLSVGFAQGAVTTGALPDPFPTVAAASAWTGGMPAFFLDNSNA